MYVPRGYISTRQAVDRLHELRNPGASCRAATTKAEVEKLYRRKSALKPPPISPITERQSTVELYNDPANRKLREASRRERPKIEAELSARALALRDYEAERVSLAVAVRVALAEGDIEACIIADTGGEFEVTPARWQADDALRALLAEQITVYLPTMALPLRGTPVIRVEVFERWADPSEDVAGSLTSAHEFRLKGWLTKEMKAQPNAPKSKAEMQAAAKAAGLTFTTRGFNRSWSEAALRAETPKWSKPGRKSKRHIDTPK